MKQTEKKYYSLPQFYLEGFTTESDKLFVYEKGNPVIRSSSPKEEGSREYYHRFFKDDGSPGTHTIKNYLERIESRARILIDGVHNRNKFTTLNKMELALILSFLLTRVALFGVGLEKIAARQTDNRGTNRAVEVFGEAIEAYQKNLGIELDFSEYDLVDQSLGRSALESLSHMFSIAYAVFPKLVNLRWRFLFSSPKVEFVTSDNPMYFYIQNEEAAIDYQKFLQSDLDLTVPLSKKVVLLAKPGGIEPGYGDAHDMTVRSINKRTVMSAISHVYSDRKSDGLQRLVQEYQGESPYVVHIDNA